MRRGRAPRFASSIATARTRSPCRPTKTAMSPAWNPTGTCSRTARIGDVASRSCCWIWRPGDSRTLATAPTEHAIHHAEFLAGRQLDRLCAVRRERLGPVQPSVCRGGDAPRRLTAGRGAENTNPTSSPDGRRVYSSATAVARRSCILWTPTARTRQLLTELRFQRQELSVRSRLVARRPADRVSGDASNDRFQIRTIRASGSTPK